jgi:hypothetical protein
MAVFAIKQLVVYVIAVGIEWRLTTDSADDKDT